VQIVSHKFVIAVLSLGLLATPMAIQTAAAQHMTAMHMGDHGMGGMHGSPFMMLLRSADLTPAQQQQIQLILNSNKPQMEALHAQLRSVHEQFAAKLLGQGTVTAADLKPLLEQAARAEADLTENMATTALAVRNVLTPAQIKKLADVHHKLHALHNQIQGLMGSGDEGGSDQ
jgi:Spy/CpxP family protein refolding chaperone